MQIDAAKLREKMEAAQRAAFPAQRAFLHRLAAEATRAFERTAPKDTNRYAASVLSGFRQAGVEAPPPPPLEPSKYRTLQRRVLERQIQTIWGRLQSTRRGITYFSRALDKCGYTSRGRPLDVQGHTWNARLLDLREMEPVWERLHKAAILQLARFNENRFAIVFGVGRANIFKFRGDSDADVQASRILPDLELVQRKSGKFYFRRVRLVVTVRQGVNGGSGVTAVANGSPVIVVRSMEPHARILERKTGVVGKALSHARSSGIRRLKRGLVTEIAAASGLRAGAA